MAQGSAPPSDEPDRRRFLLGALAAATGVGLGPVLAACTDDGDDEAGPASTTTPRGGSTTTATDGDGPDAAALREAFFAGLPLLTTYRTLQTFAPITGINKLFASPGLTNARTRLVVAPNHDTVYALAVLDLTTGPVRITLPDIPDRYHVVQIIDAWMGAVTLLGTRATGGRAGSWIVAPPDVVSSDLAPLDPTGAGEVVRCPTRHAFVLGRIRAVDDADAVAAVAIARSIRIDRVTALVGPRAPDPAPLGKPPGPPQTVGDDGAGFFDELGDVLAVEQPVTPAQTKALEAVAPLVGANRHPTTEHPDRRAGLAAAVTDGLGRLAAALDDDSGTLRNGWRVNLDLGRADDRQPLAERALVARYFWGPVPAEEAVYPKAVTADDGQPLTGTKHYRIRLAGDDLPPVDAFWSFTVYAEDLFFYPNPIDRSSLSGDTPGLVRAADGTIELALQHDQPTSPGANWLPVPDGPFHLVMRLYLPRRAILDGTWDYPPVEVVT